jgi:hypothetical protein
VGSFNEIAEREGKVERHIRVLTPLAFIPPSTLAAIIDGTGRHDVTVTALAQAVPYRWDHSPDGQFSEQPSRSLNVAPSAEDAALAELKRRREIGDTLIRFNRNFYGH